MPNSVAGGVPLLRFEQVSKSYPDGRRRVSVLDRVSFEVHAGERVGILGSRRSGKSTLLRLAAGIHAPDDGRVEFEGHDLARMHSVRRERLLRSRIGLLASDDWHPARGERVVDLVALPLLSDGATMHEARSRARKVLSAVDASDCADDIAGPLATSERMRVMLARALVREPALLLVDEPATVPGPSEREALYSQLRDGAARHRAALVVASEDTEVGRGSDVLMSIGDGELVRVGDEPANVVPFPPRPAPRPPGGLERTGL
ncbi:MAG TPA: ATP-binding cassette domain-containing protein [Solirubrobacteraceae bacterium]|nr:ATP-binding cassette domain-containing protein [Solirubrobacteraceae bacterium]